VDEDRFNEALDAINIPDLYEGDWEYRVPDGAVQINGRITYDLELYFTEGDVRALYDFYTPEYTAICELASGEYEPFTIDNYDT